MRRLQQGQESERLLERDTKESGRHGEEEQEPKFRAYRESDLLTL